MMLHSGITISRHAKERYAERIMDRDNKTDVAVFIREHEDKIRQDIEKMIEFGKLLYEGQSRRDAKKRVAVTLNGSWVVIWDTVDFNVITLYCIDLGVGDEVNRAFIAGALEKIEAAKSEQDKVNEQTSNDISFYKELIEKGEASVARYRKLIRDTESQIAASRQMIQSITVDSEAAEDKVVDAIEILIGKQRF